jgi:uncharacterized caspase-like protein
VKRLAIQLVLVFIGTVAMTSSALSAVGPAETRLALVVTNQQHEFAPLAYSHADGEIVSAALREVGFDVHVLRDGTKAQLRADLDAFVQKLKDAGEGAVAFFYFSGHCWANSTSNFVVMNEHLNVVLEHPPRPSTPKDVERVRAELPNIGVQVAEITKAIGAVNAKASFVVIDSHLEVAEPSLVVEALQTKDRKPHHGMIFAAQGAPGMPALDSNDYSRNLSGAILTPLIDASQAIKQIQLKTAEATKGKQVPWFEDRLASKFYFVPQRLDQRHSKGAASTTGTAMTPELALRLELAMWEAVNNTTDPRLYLAYLDKYPDGQFAKIADIRIKELETKSVQKPEVGKARGEQELGRRVALVVGNSKYTALSELNSPVNDAKAIAASLRRLGFAEVFEGTNLDRGSFLKTLRSFEKAAANADWALVYYSGHGMAIDGTNYLIPIDARLESPDDARDEAIPLDRLTDKASDVKVVRVVILDACRNDPYGKRKGTGEKGQRMGEKGFVPIKATGGSLIAYAATPGYTASDGDPKGYSLYTDGLIQHLEEERIDLRVLFGKVYDTVVAKSQKQQEPWIEVALPGKEIFLKP